MFFWSLQFAISLYIENVKHISFWNNFFSSKIWIFFEIEGVKYIEPNPVIQTQKSNVRWKYEMMNQNRFNKTQKNGDGTKRDGSNQMGPKIKFGR